MGKKSLIALREANKNSNENVNNIFPNLDENSGVEMMDEDDLSSVTKLIHQQQNLKNRSPISKPPLLEPDRSPIPKPSWNVKKEAKDQLKEINKLKFPEVKKRKMKEEANALPPKKKQKVFKDGPSGRRGSPIPVFSSPHKFSSNRSRASIKKEKKKFATKKKKNLSQKKKKKKKKKS